MKILSLWPWPQGHPWGGDGANKNFRPISTIMPKYEWNPSKGLQNMNKVWTNNALKDGRTDKKISCW